MMAETVWTTDDVHDLCHRHPPRMVKMHLHRMMGASDACEEVVLHPKHNIPGAALSVLLSFCRPPIQKQFLLRAIETHKADLMAAFLEYLHNGTAYQHHRAQNDFSLWSPEAAKKCILAGNISALDNIAQWVNRSEWPALMELSAAVGSVACMEVALKRHEPSLQDVMGVLEKAAVCGQVDSFCHLLAALPDEQSITALQLCRTMPKWHKRNAGVQQCIDDCLAQYRAWVMGGFPHIPERMPSEHASLPLWDGGGVRPHKMHH